MATRARSERGFTLIELMIVVGIIAILAAVAIPSYHCMSFKARQREALAVLKGIYVAENMYFGRENAFLCHEADIKTYGGVEYSALQWYDIDVSCSNRGAASVVVTLESHWHDHFGHGDKWQILLGGSSLSHSGDWLVHLESTICN